MSASNGLSAPFKNFWVNPINGHSLCINMISFMLFSCRTIEIARQCAKNCAKHLSKRHSNIPVLMYPEKACVKGVSSRHRKVM